MAVRIQAVNNRAVRSNVAIRARSVTTGNIQGGNPIPCYVVEDADLIENGGTFKVAGNNPDNFRVYIATGETPLGGSAIPIYVVGGTGGGGTSLTAPYNLQVQVPLGDYLTLWLDAADISTLWQDSAQTTPVTADTDPVGSWDDKSSSANHAQQGTAGNRPQYRTSQLNGQPGILFDGTSDILEIVSPSGLDNVTGMTWFMVVEDGLAFRGILSYWNSPSNNAWLHRSFNTDATRIYTFIASTTADAGSNYVLSAVNSFPNITTSPYIISVTYDGTNATNANRVKQYSFGSIVTAPTTGTIATSMPNATGSAWVGGTYAGTQLWPGLIYEILVYNRLLNATEHNQVGNYLATKYGQTWNDL